MATPADTALATHQSLALINHLARVSQRGSEAALEPLGLRPRHLVTLTLLRDHGAATQAGLADALRMDPSNVVAVLNELERASLLQRRRDPEDRRRHIVELSADGRATLETAERTLAAVQDDVLGALSEDERGTLHALLQRAAGGVAGTSCTEVAAEDAAAATDC